MSRFLRALTVVAVAGIAWGITSFWCTNPAECFYFVIPVVACTVFVTGLSNPRQAFRARVRPALVIGAGWIVAAVGLVYCVFSRRVMLSGSFWLEFLTAVYFLTAVVIFLLTILRLLRASGRFVHARWCNIPALRFVICEAAPLFLFILFALPYGMAFSNVHRFKLTNLTDPKRERNRDFEEIEFASADGTILRGWWIAARRPSARTLVICHGLAANRSIFLPFTETADWLDANILMFDMRGHGDSGGHTVTLGCREKDDILAAVAWARRERPEQARQVIGMGISLGAASLALAAAEAQPPLDAVILDSCFTSSRDMTDSVLRAFPSFCHDWLMTLGLPLADLHAGCPMMEVSPESSIGRLRAPVVFLHSRGDPLIPSSHALRLYERACEPKVLHIFELNGHCDAFFARREKYRAAVVALLPLLEKRQSYDSN
jgi:alpha-beta hydrolase superfamily lysophospholipase